jgi:hypothetical protein
MQISHKHERAPSRETGTLLRLSLGPSSIRMTQTNLPLRPTLAELAFHWGSGNPVRINNRGKLGFGRRLGVLVRGREGGGRERRGWSSPARCAKAEGITGGRLAVDCGGSGDVTKERGSRAREGGTEAVAREMREVER